MSLLQAIRPTLRLCWWLLSLLLESPPLQLIYSNRSHQCSAVLFSIRFADLTCLLQWWFKKSGVVLVIWSVIHRGLGQGQQLNSCYWLSKKKWHRCWPCHKFAAPVPMPPAVQTSLLKTDCVCILVAEIVWGFVISTLWSQRRRFLKDFTFSSAKGATLCCALTRLENKAVFKWKSPAFSSLHPYKLNMTSCFCHSSY